MIHNGTIHKHYNRRSLNNSQNELFRTTSILKIINLIYWHYQEFNLELIFVFYCSVIPAEITIYLRIFPRVFQKAMPSTRK